MTAPAWPPLWRQREYMLLWTGQVAATLGSSASGIVVPLLVLAMTGSAAAAGFASALAIVPYVLLSLPVGVLVDRWDRQRVMVVCDIGRALVTLSLVAALLLDALTLAHLYTVAVLQGICMVFFNLAEVAALPRVVATVQLPQAIAQNQAGHSGAAIAGPALGTWLLQHGGRALPFASTRWATWPRPGASGRCARRWRPRRGAWGPARAACAPRWRWGCAGCGSNRWCGASPG